MHVDSFPRIFKDISYLCGLIIADLEQITKDIPKLSTESAINSFIKHIWKLNHDQKLTRNAKDSRFKLTPRENWDPPDKEKDEK